MTPSDKQEDSGSKPTQDAKDSSTGTGTVTESSGTHDAGTQKLNTVGTADTAEANDGETGSAVSKAQAEPAPDAGEVKAQSASAESATATSESSSGPPPAPDWDAWGASSGGNQSEWGEPDWDASSGGAVETPPWQRVAAAPSPADSDSTQAIPVPNLGESDADAAPSASGVPNHDQSTVRTSTVSPGGPGSGGEQIERTSVSFAGDSSATARTSFGSGSAAGSAGAAAASAASARRPSRGPRRASLQVKRADPWSVLKLALVLSVALFFVWMIAVAVLYGVLDGMGVWDQLNGTFTELTQPEDAASEPLISAGRVFGVAAIIGGINIVLITALATVGAFIYNVAADFAGGVELTLSERE